MKNPYSAVKIFHHKEALDALKNHEHKAPFYVRIKPTNLCNHHCAYCTYGSGDTHEKTQNRDNISHSDMIPWDKLREIITDMRDMGVKALTFSGGGEPLTYPNIVDAAYMADNFGLELSLISNGQLLSGERAKAFYNARWVRISFDAPRADVYTKLRGISAESFRQVTDNIADFARCKNKNCVLGVNFVVSKSNHHLVYESARFLKGLGVNNVKFAAVVENVANYHDSIRNSVNEQIAKAIADLADNTFGIINNYEHECLDAHLAVQPFPICYTCHLVTVIGADQKAYLCHTRCYDSEAVIGDLRENTFKKLWFSEHTKKRLEELKPMRDCKNICMYVSRNELIQAYLDVDERHVNFI